jgi:CheY-like chemotaxis protein
MDKPLAFVIEDDQDLAFVFSAAISSAGYQVETFLDGSAAVERLATAVPYLVVLDLHLPGVTGPEIFRIIRSDPRLAEARIIIASADERLADTFRHQSALVLLKPISFVQLSGLAQRLLKKPASE